MLVDDLEIHKKTKTALKKSGFETLEDIAKAYQEKGNAAFSSDRVKSKIVPVLYDKGILKQLPSQEELEVQLQTSLLGLAEAARQTGINHVTLTELLEADRIPRDCYYVRGVDVITKAHSFTYLFHKDKFFNFMNKFSTLTSISKELNVSKDLLSKLLSTQLDEDQLSKVKLHLQHWDREWIKQNYLKLINNRTEAKRGNGTNYYEYFSDDLQVLVDNYFEYRIKNDEITFDGVVYFSQRIKKQTTLESVKPKLVRSLYKILCGRANIKNFWDTVGNTKTYRSLTIEEESELLSVEFDPIKFDEEDAKFMVAGIESDTYKWKIAAEMKPFLYYALMLAEDEYYKKLDLKDAGELPDFDSMAEKEKLFRFKRRIDKALKTDIPVKPPKKMKTAHRKVFATRSQLVQTFLSTLTNKMSHRMRYPIKNAVMILIGFLAGVRPVELWKLEIDKHLDIEKDPSHPDFGLLKKYRIERISGLNADFVRTSIDDPEGWSRLWISEGISKGTYSPSPEYGTLLVPRLVNRINEYLIWLYNLSPKEYKGQGFLFRCDEKNPFKEYAKTLSLTKWIWKVRNDFSDFLSETEIKNFSYYETRHTVNNLIVNRTLIEDKQLNDWKKRVAEVHCRHEMGDEDEKAKSRINEFHYQEDVPLWVYYSVIKESLDFPFSKTELIKWEKIHNPLGVIESLEDEPTQIDSAINNQELLDSITKPSSDMTLSAEEQEMFNDFSEKLNQLTKEYEIIKHPVKAKNIYKLEGKERRIRLSKLKAEMAELGEQLQIIRQGEAS
ncbi:hypothetical protein [Bacillus sp. ISL-39]|uniref:hypothetical protein n=1 Tax=Bacillus sp. ISL-39 TaxID=2819124 RepID=UPI001BE974ED|nr:hypothetical protein [Bacillus sp. ISL-39]MBT2636434.1 hypothetical protein [Bacillus sp. ISL-39]